MKLEIILALVLVTTLCSGHTLHKRDAETESVADTTADADTSVEESVESSSEDVALEEETSKETDETDEETEKAVDEDQVQNEQTVDVGQPVANAKLSIYEEEKRGMDVPFVSQPEVCTGWIEDFFDEYLVLSEARDAVFSDLQRFFIFMDDDGDSKISEEEFVPKWMEASGFGELDTLALFYTYFTMVLDPEDESHIVPENVEGIWSDIFMTDIDGGELPKEYFSETWQHILLPSLPKHGCSGVNDKPGVGAIVDGMKENAQIRPDVYGYYKRKRK